MTTQTIDHELIAITNECREGLLAQLKANGLDPFSFYAWALAKDLEQEAADGGIGVQILLDDEIEILYDDAVTQTRMLYEEVTRQLKNMGHHIA